MREHIPDRFPMRNVSSIYLIGLSVCLILYYSYRLPRPGRLSVMMKTLSWMALIRIGNTTNHEFTQRELDILKELTTGDSNTAIAERLCISVATVKSHIQHLLEKTGFRTRTELVSEACSLGIVIREAK